MDSHVTSLAQLAVSAGANVQPGQTVVVSARLGQEDLARAIAAAAYECDAHHVQIDYADPIAGRIRLQRAPEAALGTVMPWVRQRPALLAEPEAAWIGLSRPVAPGLLDDLDPADDENAASHIALGSGFQRLAEDEASAARVNSSAVHTDFMIGGPRGGRHRHHPRRAGDPGARRGRMGPSVSRAA